MSPSHTSWMRSLPTAITLARGVLSVVFLSIFLALLQSSTAYNAQIGGIIALWMLFILTEASDILDGFIARKYGLISDAGKVLDPLADVFSRVTYLICFLYAGILSVWLCAFIIYRELIMIALRMLSSLKHVPLAANSGGKIKTVLLAVAAGTALLFFSVQMLDVFVPLHHVLYFVVTALFVLAAGASYISLVIYLIAARRAHLI